VVCENNSVSSFILLTVHDGFLFSGAKMMYFLDPSTKDKAITLATTLSDLEGISLEVRQLVNYFKLLI